MRSWCFRVESIRPATLIFYSLSFQHLRGVSYLNSLCHRGTSPAKHSTTRPSWQNWISLLNNGHLNLGKPSLRLTYSQIDERTWIGQLASKVGQGIVYISTSNIQIIRRNFPDLLTCNSQNLASWSKKFSFILVKACKEIFIII